MYLIILLLCVTSSSVFAQTDILLRISENELTWNSPQIIYDIDSNIVYVGFKDKQIELKLEIKAYSESKQNRRNELAKLLVSDKAIFVQGYKDQASVTHMKDCYNLGDLVIPNNGNLYSLASVKLNKDSLPATLYFKDATIKIVAFDPDIDGHCEAIRKYAAVCNELPMASEIDTIYLDSIDTGAFQLKGIDIKKTNTAWEIGKPKYNIDSTECKAEGNVIIVPERFLKPGCRFDIKYDLEFKHDFFTHSKSGVLKQVYISSSNSFLPLWLIWLIRLTCCILGMVLLGLGCWWGEKELKKYILTKRKKELEKAIQTYLEELDSDKKKNKIIEWINKGGEEFKSAVAKVVGFNTDYHLPNPSVDYESQKNIDTLNSNVDTLTTERIQLIPKCNKIADLETRVKLLDGEISGYKQIITDKDRNIEQLLQNIKNCKEQLSRISRQNMYLLQIDDALKEVSEEVLQSFYDVDEGELKKKLVLPLLNGVAGLDDGITTYYSRWQKQVMSVQHDFFGKELYEMNDEEVKHKLISGFLKNLAQGDTFSKLTRLYMYIQADWINEILIKNKFKVDIVEKIFNRLRILFNEFGIEIIYPRLFVDHMNDQQYTFDPRCEVFKLFPIDEDMRMRYSKQTDLIIDIVQIGVRIPVEQYSRKAIVSIPNF